MVVNHEIQNQGIVSSVEIVTPDIALQMLSGNTNNRRLRPGAVKRLADAIRRGEWSVSHQGIAFDERGRLLDGQHRLTAIIEAGIPCELLVARNVPTGSFGVMDQGMRRTMADISGADRRVTDACNFAAKIVYGGSPTFAQVEPVIASRIGAKLVELIEYCGSTKRYYTSAPMKLACAISAMKSNLDQEYAFNNYRALANLDFDGMSMSGKALVRQVQSGIASISKNRGDTLARAIAVFDLSRSDNTKIQVSDTSSDEAVKYVRSFVKSEISDKTLGAW